MLQTTTGAGQGGATTNISVSDGFYNVRVEEVTLANSGKYYNIAGVIDDGDYEGAKVTGRLFNTAKAAWAMDRMKVSCGLPANAEIEECVNHVGRAKCGTDNGGYTDQILFWCDRGNWNKSGVQGYHRAKTEQPAQTVVQATPEPVQAEPVKVVQPAQTESAKMLPSDDEAWKIDFANAVIENRKLTANVMLQTHGVEVPEILSTQAPTMIDGFDFDDFLSDKWELELVNELYDNGPRAARAVLDRHKIDPPAALSDEAIEAVEKAVPWAFRNLQKQDEAETSTEATDFYDEIENDAHDMLENGFERQANVIYQVSDDELPY